MAALYVFPDTNVLMHFRRVDQLNWQDLAGSRDVVIVLAPIVLRELEKHKDQPQHRRGRQRARNIVGWLREQRRSKQDALPNGVKLQIEPVEPTQFLADGLDPDVADDRLIASVLARRAVGHMVAVLTDDTLLLHKLDAHEIRAIELPEKLRLMDEPDTTEVENSNLKKQVAAFENRVPKLAVKWRQTGSVEIRQNLSVDTSKLRTPSQIRLDHPKLSRKNRVSSNLPRMMAASFNAQLSMIPQSALEEYDEQLGVYYEEYNSYYETSERVAGIRSRRITLALEVENSGTAIAHNVVVRLNLPAGIEPTSDDEPKFPEPPRLPQMPTFSSLGMAAALARIGSERWSTRNLFSDELLRPRIPHPGAPTINAIQRTISWEADYVRHGVPEELYETVCILDPAPAAAQVVIGVSIHVEELSTATLQELIVQVE